MLTSIFVTPYPDCLQKPLLFSLFMTPGVPVQFLDPQKQIVVVCVGDRVQLQSRFISSEPVASCWIHNKRKVWSILALYSSVYFLKYPFLFFNKTCQSLIILLMSLCSTVYSTEVKRPVNAVSRSFEITHFGFVFLSRLYQTDVLITQMTAAL